MKFAKYKRTVRGVRARANLARWPEREQQAESPFLPKYLREGNVVAAEGALAEVFERAKQVPQVTREEFRALFGEDPPPSVFGPRGTIPVHFLTDDAAGKLVRGPDEITEQLQELLPYNSHSSPVNSSATHGSEEDDQA